VAATGLCVFYCSKQNIIHHGMLGNYETNGN
jgi:hypothetical protein